MEIDPIHSEEELSTIMQGLLDDDDRIDFLWRYISEQPNGDHEVLALVYEALGKLYIRTERARGDVYQMAGEHWESVWADALTQGQSSRRQRQALQNAMINYRKASSIFAQTNSSSLTEALEWKMREVRGQLRAYGRLGRSVLFTGSTLSVVLSLVFITNTITGLAVLGFASPGVSIGLGIFLFLVALAGFYFALKW